MTVYELSFLILPSIPEDKLSDVVNSIRKVVTKEGGIEIDAEAPFKQPLAYSMSKTIGASHYVLTDAYLGWIKFEVEPANVLAIKVGVEKIEEILRFLLVKAPRETIFTFAKARAVLEDKEEPTSVEARLPDGQDSGVAKEVVVE
ncbi:MAG: 30S ribosomal protein S6 [bacterium]|nr:30S ribosomal protein S6 [bacterium]